jgi:hypothetical protein
MSKKQILLGRTKGENPENIYLYDFAWECGWYWAGGYIGNRNMHCHFDGAFLKVPDHRGHSLGNFTPQNLSNGCAIWEDLSTFLDHPQFDEQTWWRIKDLFKQFYALTAAAECFQYGGHCTSNQRNPAELNKEMADSINKHIANVIIPEIRKVTGLTPKEDTTTEEETKKILETVKNTFTTAQ